MNNTRTKRLPKILLGQFLVSVLIFIVGSYLITYSMGYKINLSTRKIIKTGLIVLLFDEKPDSILLGNKEIAPKENVSIPLEPGFYDVLVKRSGYQDWSIRCEVKPELVNYYKYVELFKPAGEIVEISDQSIIDALNTPSTVLAVSAPKGLRGNDYEIWVKDKLITRFSSAISQVSWFPDNHHILFQQGSEIHVIDEDGSNDKVIVELPSPSPAKFMVSPRDQKLYFAQDGKYYSAEIQ